MAEVLKTERLKGIMERSKKFATCYMQVVLHISLFLLIVVFPYYAPNGYVKLGVHKCDFFRTVGIGCFVLMLPAAIFLFAYQWKHRALKRLSATDKAMLLYAAAVILSYVCTEWRKEALLGTEGWSMGLLSQLMFVAIYFGVSRFGEKTEICYAVFLAASFGVFLLGLLNRFSVYPFGMDPDAPATFISTIGNINWFCGYWSVVFPIGLVLYWSGKGEELWKKAALMIYVILGFTVGIVQGSSSGFLTLGAVLAVLLFMSFEGDGRLLRWLELVSLFAVSALLVGAVKQVFPMALNYQNEIEEWVTQYQAGGSLFAVTAVCHAACRYLHKKKQKSLKTAPTGGYQPAIAGVCLIGLMFAAVVVYGNIAHFEPEEASSATSFFQFSIYWGNGRGAAWMAGVRAFASMPLFRKFVGVGPDCFAGYAYGNPDIAAGLYFVFGTFRLTNVHNELLTVLVNTGICGFLSYAAVFVTALLRQFRAGKRDRLLTVSAVCIFAYAVHNMVSFQQVCSTPFVFVLMGTGERLLRKEE